MLVTTIRWFGDQMILACDGNCSKAWGINARPRVRLSSTPGDFAYLADDELGEAPRFPGSSEGGHSKPTDPSTRLNKWCARECERSVIAPPPCTIELRDFSVRLPNRPKGGD